MKWDLTIVAQDFYITVSSRHSLRQLEKQNFIWFLNDLDLRWWWWRTSNIISVFEGLFTQQTNYKIPKIEVNNDAKRMIFI